ncbi:rho guanine nucleotide exchange factor 10 isoform X3 [Schistocerca cancellata]|uniref:rho guanine nucleotide exchange factor 10 isoform X3 n=1 Tax=Schistocerca cancellata TaxID=274614 RepID=UPI0021186930|nr:rho guanine nucleotide exchange factor 10 isoform X3 [Schistocerca cancellata]
MPGHAPRDLASPLPFDEPRVGSGSWEERAAPGSGPVPRPDDSCWLSASDGDLSSGDESERSSNKSNGQARATLGSKARTLCDKWRGRPSATLPAAGGSSGPLVSEAAPEAVAVPGGRLSRWFSIRRGSTHQYDVDTGGGGGGSCDRVPTPNKMPLLPEVEEENGTTFAAFGRRQMPPTLPPPPHGLTPEQLKRRHIVAAIVHSENSYVATLHRLVNDYKKPLEESTPPILSPAKIQTLFLRLPEILQCHTLFRIALAECVRSWDRDERIGDVFVASFSKAVVLEIYSDFINNFSSAMDLAKMEAKRKSALADFFKVKQISAHDRLSFFGLMVKPVQRFPQFILFLQDLLKHTPQGHHDRMSLQLALTQLESLAEMLNERKREAEQFQAFKEMMRHISGRFAARSRPDGHRYLLREDNVTQLEFNQAGMITKSKSRRLLLLNDMVVCVSVTPKTTDDFSGSERLSLKWSYPVTDIEVVDTSTSPTLSRLLAAGLNRGGSLKSDRSSTSLDSNMSGSGAADNLCAEMNDLMHDYEVVSRIADLVSTLKGNYKDLNVPGIRRILSEIQGSIQQKDEEMAWVDSCCLQLAVKTKGKEETFTFQTDNPSVKKEWITELRLAQLALDPNNSPAWEVPEQERRPSTKMPLFVRAQPVYRSQHETEVRCGCFYSAGSLAATRDHRSSRRGRRPASYLWVCTTDGASSHVAVLAQPQQQAAQLREVTAFDLVETRVTAVEFVRGSPDAVWMGTDSRRLVLYKASEPERQEEVGSVVVPAVVVQIRAHGESVFVALADGSLQRFRKASDDTWLLREPQTLSLGMDPVSSLLPINSCLYAACGKKVWVLGPSGDVQKNFSVQHEHVGSVNLMAHSGIGLWISLKNSSTICLYHTETFKHLQDINIASNIACLPRGSGNGGPVTVTALMACKGLLWVGTDAGVCLTVPLPRLEGVPIISGRVNISYHAHFGPISFLLALQPRSNKEFTHQEPQNQQSPASVGGGDLSSETSSSSSALRNDVHLGSPVVLRRRRPRDIDPLARGSKTLPRGLGGGSAASSASGDGCDVYGLYGELMYVRDYEGEGRAGTGGVTDGGVGGTATDAGYGSLRRSDPELAAVPGRVSTLDRRLLLAAGRPRSLDLSSWSVDSRASTSSGSEDASRPVDNLVQCPPTPIPLPPDPEPRQPPPPHDPGAVPRRTVVTLMGGRGYVNWRQQGKGGPEPNSNDAHIVIWEMKL